jgi:hypothetical protein
MEALTKPRVEILFTALCAQLQHLQDVDLNANWYYSRSPKIHTNGIEPYKGKEKLLHSLCFKWLLCNTRPTVPTGSTPYYTSVNNQVLLCNDSSNEYNTMQGSSSE